MRNYSTIIRRSVSRRRPTAALVFLALATLLFSGGCARLHGWGLVLWSVEAPAVAAGTVAPIYIKSNIQKAYVIGVPETKEKAEVPFWKIEVYTSRRAAREAAASFAEVAPLYGLCLRDGLAIREAPNNRAKQVYRLRLEQPVKLLEIVEGEEVQTGGRVLEGEWWLALTEDGTRGYVFSNQLRVFDESKEGRPRLATEAGEADERRVGLLFSRTWRPAYFDDMVAESRIDLGRFQPRYGFFADAAQSQVRLELPTRSQAFPYAGISTDGSEVVFEGSPLRVRFESDKRVVAIISDGSAQIEEAFTDFSGDVLALARDEETRRATLLASVLSGGGKFTSSQVGVLSLLGSGRFTWGAYEYLVGPYLEEYAGDGGTLAFDLFLGPAVAAEWDGALSLRFDGTAGAPATLRLAYRMEPGSAEFAVVRADALDGALLMTPPAGEVLRFSRSAR